MGGVDCLKRSVDILCDDDDDDDDDDDSTLM